jgi:hypothetical protein
MTELEYEKACRGPLSPSYYEYAWGTSELAGNYGSPYQLSYQGTESEGISSGYSESSGNANHFYSNWIQEYGFVGPFRVGIFAANGANTGRVTSGASYWGIMELTGNVAEQCVSLYNLDGRKFEGHHGDGLLQSNGYHNQTDWPTDIGLMNRGGSFSGSNYELFVSARPNYNYGAGFRAVRTHPSQ